MAPLAPPVPPPLSSDDLYEAFTVISSKSDLHGHLTFLRTVVPFWDTFAVLLTVTFKKHRWRFGKRWIIMGKCRKLGGGGRLRFLTTWPTPGC